MEYPANIINGNLRPYLTQTLIHRYELRWVVWERIASPDGEYAKKLKGCSKIFDTHGEAEDERHYLIATCSDLFLAGIHDRYSITNGHGGETELSEKRFREIEKEKKDDIYIKETIAKMHKPYVVGYRYCEVGPSYLFYSTAEERDVVAAELATERDCSNVTVYDYPDSEAVDTPAAASTEEKVASAVPAQYQVSYVVSTLSRGSDQAVSSAFGSYASAVESLVAAGRDPAFQKGEVTWKYTKTSALGEVSEISEAEYRMTGAGDSEDSWTLVLDNKDIRGLVYDPLVAESYPDELLLKMYDVVKHLDNQGTTNTLHLKRREICQLLGVLRDTCLFTDWCEQWTVLYNELSRQLAEQDAARSTQVLAS